MKIGFKNIVILLLLIVILFLSVFVGLKFVYPHKYKDIVSNYSNKYDVDASLIHAVIWVESKYDKDAKSRVGALGLMQLMPSTAEWLSSQIDIKDKAILDPDYNIHLGVYYLSTLIKRFESTDLGIAAYNAGPSNVSAWLHNPKYSKDNNLTYIPYKETREYLNKVNSTKKIYQRLYW